MVLYYFIYLFIGKLLIWTIQIYPLTSFVISKTKGYPKEYLEKLFGCDFCLGVWVYFFLAIVAKETIFPLNYNIFVTIVSYFLTGLVSAFIMHLITLGWNEKFRIMEIK